MSQLESRLFLNPQLAYKRIKVGIHSPTQIKVQRIFKKGYLSSNKNLVADYLMRWLNEETICLMGNKGNYGSKLIDVAEFNLSYEEIEERIKKEKKVFSYWNSETLLNEEKSTHYYDTFGNNTSRLLPVLGFVRESELTPEFEETKFQQNGLNYWRKQRDSGKSLVFQFNGRYLNPKPNLIFELFLGDRPDLFPSEIQRDIGNGKIFEIKEI